LWLALRSRLLWVVSAAQIIRPHSAGGKPEMRADHATRY